MIYVSLSAYAANLIHGAFTRMTCPLIGDIFASLQSFLAPNPVQLMITSNDLFGTTFQKVHICTRIYLLKWLTPYHRWSRPKNQCDVGRIFRFGLWIYSLPKVNSILGWNKQRKHNKEALVSFAKRWKRIGITLE